ncbi:MAG: hypothetical protein RIK87_24370 [Fuerstiella sp.]
MAEYQARSPEVAAFVHRKNAECEAQRKRLADASADDAWQIAMDTTESDAARLESILVLIRNHDDRLSDLVLSLFDEPDLTVWRSVIRSFHPDCPGIRERLREFAKHHDDDAIAAEALCVLAQMNDASTVSICQDWLTRGQSSRNAAVETLRLLGGDASMKILEQRWADAGLTDEDRNTLALALTHFQHRDASNHVLDLARTGTCSWSVAAATTLYLCTPSTGLRCMMDILDTGTPDARRAMVHQISSLAGHLTHEYTADGIHEARLWVETQLAGAS